MGASNSKRKKKQFNTMTNEQKNRQKHAIWNYYKKKSEKLTSSIIKK